MRVTTLLAFLVALLAVPAARVSGLIGGSSPAPPLAVAPPPAAVPALVPTTAGASEPTAPTPSSVVPLAPPPTPTVRILPTLSWTVAVLRPGGVDVFADPATPGPSVHLTDQTEFGTRRVLPVIGRVDTWLEVRLPVRPNNAIGWLQERDVELSSVADRITVSLEARQLSWYHSLGQAGQAPIAVGSPDSPTPRGEFYVTDVIPSSDGYGPWILALNGHSDTLTDFEGGDARLAIHGTDDPGSVGAAVSHGCVRVANDLDRQLAATIRPGTVVEIG
jgi:hypothetical protein